MPPTQNGTSGEAQQDVTSEFHDLLNGCGLTSEQAAIRCGVDPAETVSWDIRPASIPTVVHQYLRQIDAEFQAAVDRLRTSAVETLGAFPNQALSATLVGYHTEVEFHHYRSDLRGLPLRSHAALNNRCRSAMASVGLPTRIVYLDVAAYHEWRNGQADTEELRITWAIGQP